MSVSKANRERNRERNSERNREKDDVRFHSLLRPRRLQQAGAAAEERAADAGQQRKCLVALCHCQLGLLGTAVARGHRGVQGGAAVLVVPCSRLRTRQAVAGVVCGRCRTIGQFKANS